MPEIRDPTPDDYRLHRTKRVANESLLTPESQTVEQENAKQRAFEQQLTRQAHSLWLIVLGLCVAVVVSIAVIFYLFGKQKYIEDYLTRLPKELNQNLVGIGGDQKTLATRLDAIEKTIAELELQLGFKPGLEPRPASSKLTLLERVTTIERDLGTTKETVSSKGTTAILKSRISDLEASVEKHQTVLDALRVQLTKIEKSIKN